MTHPRLVRRLALVAVILAIVAAIVWALRPVPLPIEAVTVANGTMMVTLDEEGETRVRDRYVVSAPLAGRVLRIELEPGDPVTANRTALASFLPTPATLLDARTRAELQARVSGVEASLRAARAEQERTRAESAQAERDLQRARELVAAGALPRDRLEAAELAATTLRNAVARAQANVAAAEAELQMARASVATPTADRAGSAIVLRSPISGVVLRRLRESEAIVPQGEPLLEVGDVSKLEIVADFLSSDAVRISAGQRVLIERWGGGDALTGRVRRVEPSGFTKISALGVEEQRVNVLIDFEDARDAFARLGDRYRVEVRVVVWESGDVVKVPIGSLVRDGDQWSVFAVSAGRAVRTPITIGRRNDAEAEVTTGLSPGMTIIAFPGDDVADGVLVEQVREGR
jgi:HlyD family secretion protein